MTRSFRVLFACFICTELLACSRPKSGEPATLTVAAASDLGPAFQELGAAFQREAGVTPRFTFGSTGLLAKQLHEGGPFDVFAAANVQYADDAVRAGDCDASTKALYARGRIASWTRAEVPVPSTLSDLADAKYAKIAIANPEHAPYGKAAKEAMEHAGVWATVEPRIVYGENVQQTLKFAQSGNADVALVALSLVIVTPGGHHALIDEALHRPIDQALAACRHGKNFEGGRRFAEFVNSKKGRDIMKRYGFLLPGETVARSP